MKKLIFSVVILFVAGCAPFTGIDINDGRSYEINQPIETSTGSVMISVSDSGKRYRSFEPRFIQESPLGTLAPGQEWVAFNALKSDPQKYILTSTQFDDQDVGIIVNSNGEITDEQPIIKHMKKKPFRKPWIKMKFDHLKDKQLFAYKKLIMIRDGDFVIHLLYNGVANNIISLTYREFYKDFARPAFSQEMTYDLNTSDIITFRTIKMKILSANNSEIAFQVIEDGDLPWVRHR